MLRERQINGPVILVALAAALWITLVISGSIRLAHCLQRFDALMARQEQVKTPHVHDRDCWDN